MLAYLDPGAGSSIAAVLAGGTAGVAVLYRVARERVTSRLRRAGGARARMVTDTNGAGAADPVDGADEDELSDRVRGR